MVATVKEFTNAVMLFEAEFIANTVKNANRFALGIAFRAANQRLEGAIAAFTKDGKVDCGELRKTVDAGMEASGGKLVLEPQIDPAIRMLGVSIKDITITRAEADRFFDEILPAAQKPLEAVQ